MNEKAIAVRLTHLAVGFLFWLLVCASIGIGLIGCAQTPPAKSPAPIAKQDNLQKALIQWMDLREHD